MVNYRVIGCQIDEKIAALEKKNKALLEENMRMKAALTARSETRSGKSPLTALTLLKSQFPGCSKLQAAVDLGVGVEYLIDWIKTGTGM